MLFLDALTDAKKKNKNVVIPDIKCFSPKEGDLMKGRNPVEYAKCLVNAGAPVLSVVTEGKEFHGSLAMLKAISDAVKVPILRKDFIHTREELLETKNNGASAILLMCSCLEKEELKYLYSEALALGLDPFVETHVKEDFDLVNELSAKLVGINNRDITVLERDEGNVTNTVSLAKYAPKDAFLVTESSIKNPDEVRRAIAVGADAALVGTAILNATYTESFYQMMCRKVSLKICGLMNKEDVDLCVKLGVDRIGFVAEYPLPVQWNLSKEKAKEIRSYIPEGFKACMIAGGTIEEIVALAKDIKPNMVQIHYRENIEVTRDVSTILKEAGIEAIKSLPSGKESTMEQFGTEDLEEIMDMIEDSDVYELLIDPRHGSKVTSNNLNLDIDLARKVMEISKLPVCIAGGINENNLEEIMNLTGCKNIDIMNGSEDEPGKKNPEKIKKIIQIIENI